ncbi:hypothetical protein DL546_005308 [Coniochaeta pulveracea]|uniref:Uncharacterized protein n=1 Tax=Coniochaeta pulveracea TaxID=177199 RepID=A0A420YCD3_9PEZI|nr:hypothetical protein DL546_005308 [Coniochaeta pulveracea]
MDGREDAVAFDSSVFPPLLHQTIPEHFAGIVSQYGDRNAVIARSPTTSPEALTSSHVVPQAIETTLTYSGLDLTSNILAHSLRSLGVRKGDRVGVTLGNTPEFASLTYAIFKLGAILVPLNPGFNSQQVTAALTHLGVEVLIIGAVTDLAYKPCRGRSNLDCIRTIVPDLKSGRIESETVPTLKKVIVVDNTASHPHVDFNLAEYPSLTPFSELIPSGFHSGFQSSPSARPLVPDEPLSADEIINIQFTSGTTSHPKAAMLRHTNILNNGSLIGSRMGLVPDDTIVCPPPLFHCFGCVLGYGATVSSGAAILFPSPAFDPLASVKMVADHKATGLYGVATMYVAMLEIAAQKGLDIQSFKGHLRKGIAAGSSVPESLMRRLYASIGLEELVICYGMTETSPVSCMTTPHDPFEKRTRSVGRVMPHTKVKIVDPLDKSRVVDIGERGELATAGYLVMKGYWGDKARTEEVRIEEDGGEVWMYSGDEASMDADGYVAITGRIKDLIIRGGENIHPLEIENCLFQHPLIAEVSVVGVPDERYGEAVCAFIILHKGVQGVEGDEGVKGSVGEEYETELVGMGHYRGSITKEEVREWVRTKLSGHLVPKYVLWVDEYPKTASGKIQKFKLRDRAIKELHFGGGA